MLPVSTIHTVHKEFSLRVLQFHNPPQSIALLCYIILLLWPKQKYLFLLFICRNSHTSISVSIFGKRVSADWIFPCNWACLFGRKSHYTVSCYCIYPLYIKVHIQLFSSNKKNAVNFWIKVEMRNAGKDLLTTPSGRNCISLIFLNALKSHQQFEWKFYKMLWWK